MSYQSPKSISKRQLPALKKELELFLLEHRQHGVRARSLRRKVFFDELPQAITMRKKESKKRLQCFIAAIDIVRKSDDVTESRGKKSEKQFEIVGESACGKKVYVHIREEVDKQKDRKLQFISCFFAEK